MSSPRLHRTVKGRILLYILGVALVFCYLYFSDSKHESDSTCQMERDTLNRQLQVLIEYKSRMEKSLAEERGAHLQYLSEAKSHLEEDRERQDALKQHFKLLQSQFDDLSEECNKIKNLNKANTESLEKFKEKYLQEKVARETIQHQLDEKCNGEEQLQMRVSQLEKENYALKSNQKARPKEIVLKSPDGNEPNSAVLRNPFEEPDVKNVVNKVDKSTSKITPKTKSSTKSSLHSNIPAGVVPVMPVNLSEKNNRISPSKEPMVKNNIDLPNYDDAKNDNEQKIPLNLNFNRYVGKIDQSELDNKNNINMADAIAEIRKENDENVIAEKDLNKDNAGDIHLDNNAVMPEGKIGEQEMAGIDHVAEEPEPDDFHDSHDAFNHEGARNSADEDDDDAEYMAPDKNI